MNQKLTHRQAVIAHAMLFDAKTLKHIQKGHGLALGGELMLTLENAESLLAEYNREFVTVRREDLKLAVEHLNANIIHASTVAEIPTHDAEIVRDRLRAELEAT